MRKYLCFILFIIYFSGPLHAQTPDSLADLKFLSDTTTTLSPTKQVSKTAKKPRINIRKFILSNYPNPGRAALYSFLIPGMGQVYNKKFWKVPIVYTGVGTMIYFIGKNASNYKRYRTAYRFRVDGDDTTIDEFVDVYSQADRLKDLRDGYRKRREQSYIGLIAAMALSSADAFVDAHLLKFNVSDDLSLKVEPSVINSAGSGMSYGVGLRLQWSN